MRNLKENRSQLKRSVLYISILYLISSCYSVKKLNIDDLQPISENEILGQYEQQMRHYSVINLDSAKTFQYKFNTSFKRGYFVGTYSLTANHLTLESDSLVSEKFSDILAGDKIVNRSLDTTRFTFIVTEKGLHEKIEEDDDVQNVYHTMEESA